MGNEAVLLMKTRTLHCEAGGHDWEAPSQRGKVPKNCPDHGGKTALRVDHGVETAIIDAELVSPGRLSGDQRAAELTVKMEGLKKVKKDQLRYIRVTEAEYARIVEILQAQETEYDNDIIRRMG